MRQQSLRVIVILITCFPEDSDYTARSKLSVKCVLAKVALIESLPKSELVSEFVSFFGLKRLYMARAFSWVPLPVTHRHDKRPQKSSPKLQVAGAPGRVPQAFHAACRIGPVRFPQSSYAKMAGSLTVQRVSALTVTPRSPVMSRSTWPRSTGIAGADAKYSPISWRLWR
jgi:hypothetical protein